MALRRAGLAVLPRGETTLRHFGSTEGVCCGPVLDGVELGGKLYLPPAGRISAAV